MPARSAPSAHSSLPGIQPLPGRLALGDRSLRAGVPALLTALLLLLVPRCLQPLLSGMRAAQARPLAQAAPPAAHLAVDPSPSSLSPGFAAPVRAWSEHILLWSSEYQLDPNLIATVMQIESCGDPTAISSAGAMGLFQVMPFHFAEGENPLDPEDNARRGLMYLASCLARAQGDVARALAGYNGGPRLLSLPAQDWPDETRRYVRWGTSILREVASGSRFSPTLEQWLAAGGESLCRMAAGHVPSPPASP